MFVKLLIVFMFLILFMADKAEKQLYYNNPMWPGMHYLNVIMLLFDLFLSMNLSHLFGLKVFVCSSFTCCCS